MGVTGLWKLVESSGKPVPLETLENKVLAIDISIWLHQVVKGFQDNKGSALPNAHLLGLFHRLCKLLFYKIKPVFVFDGGIPQLKRDTIAKRISNKNKIQTEADRLQQLLLDTLAKEKVVQQALGGDVENFLSPQKKIKGSNEKEKDKPEKDDLFKLPPLKEDLGASTSFDTSGTLDDSSSSCDEKSVNNLLNINSINVDSKYFKSLPPDVRHELLVDIKETRKQSSWGRLHELPAQSYDFSEFQMKRLLKRRKVQVSLEEAEKEMGGKCLSMGELENLLNEDGVLEIDESKKTQHIASNENVRYLLVRDIKKAMEAAKEKSEKEEDPSPSKRPKIEEESLDALQLAEALGEEYDEDLETAIQMSLMQEENAQESKPDDYDMNYAKMTIEQKQQLSNAAMTLARGYMMEYGGISSEDINDIILQNDKNDEFNETIQDLFQFNDSTIVGSSSTQETLSKLEKFIPTKVNNDGTATYISSDGDSDFVEVPDDDFDEFSCIPKVVEPGKPINQADLSKDFRIEDLKLKDKILEVVIKTDPADNDATDDLFADVFCDIVKKEEVDAPKVLPSKVESVVKLPLKAADDDVIMQEEKVPLFEISDDSTDDEVIEQKNEKPSTVDAKKISEINEKIQNELKVMKESLASTSLEKVISTKPIDLPVSELSDSGDELIRIASADDIGVIHDSDADSNATVVLDEDDIPDFIQLANKTVQEKECVNIEEIPEAKPLSVVDQIRLDLNKELKALKKQTLKIEDSGIVISNDSAFDEQLVDSTSEVIEIIDDDNKMPIEQERTPKKKIPTGDENVPKVPSPFFVKRTPPSSRKKQKIESESSENNAKVAKSLFPPTDSLQDTIEVAAKALKENKTEAELTEMAAQLFRNEKELLAEKNKQERMGTNITQKMSVECMNLLRLFGIPYIEAPMEAEAQCAYLNQIELTDGTITDDSDVWLFGGKTVYKNFFNQQKLVMEFRQEIIEKCFNVDRKKLIQLAMLVGSDYTEGISGIGAVTALEILAAFPSAPVMEGATNDKMATLSGLRKFREWFFGGKSVGPMGRTALKSKLRNIVITDRFPNPNIVDAYLYPTVDNSRENFNWGVPDAESIREFAKVKFGWTSSKTDDMLLPVLKKLNEKKNQQAITNYFKIQTSIKSADNLKISKRVKSAVDKMSGIVSPDEENSEKPKKSRVRKMKEATVTDGDDENQPSTSKVSKEPKPEKSKVPVQRKRTAKTAGKKTSDIISSINADSAQSLNGVPSSSKIPRIPNTTHVIPQKEKTIQQLEANKQKAAEIFRKKQNKMKN